MRPARRCRRLRSVSGPRSSQTSSTRPAATKDEATRAPPSTNSRVMPFSASACSTPMRSSPGGGVDRGGNPDHLRAGGAELHRRRRFRQVRRHHPQRRRARRMNQPAGAWLSAARDPAPPAPANAPPCPAGGRSAADRRPARCRSRPGWRRIARAADAPALSRLRPMIAIGLRPAAPILSSADTASLRITCGRLSRMRRKCPAWSCAASSAPSPISTAMPAARKPGMALPGHLRVGILDRRHHARDSGGDDRIGAGRRFADMRARLQRHIERGAAGGLAGARQRLRLGMGTAAGLGPAAADDDAVLDHDRADGRIGPGAALPAPPERQRELHEALVGGLRTPSIFARTALPECGRSFA